MNRKIPLRVLAESVAEATGMSMDASQQFIKDAFSLIGDELKNGETVDFPGLGVFSVSQNHDCPVSFKAAPQIADDLNAPFAMFEPMVMGENVSEEELNAIIVDDDNSTASAISVDAESLTSVPEISEERLECDIESNPDEDGTRSDVVGIEMDVEPSSMAIAIEEELPTENMLDAVADESDEEPCVSEDSFQLDENVQNPERNHYIEEDDEEYVTETEPQSSRFWIGFIVGLLAGLLIGAIGFIAVILYMFDSAPPIVE